MNPMFFMFQANLMIWSSMVDAMQSACSEMLIVRPPAKLVLIRGGRKG